MAQGALTTIKDDGTTRDDYLFRVALKAVIYNPEGKLLVVKEHGMGWGLPGGGMDFGETFEQALARELYEEVGYNGGFDFEVIDTTDPMYLSGIDAWQVNVVFHVRPERYNFSVGKDADDMTFIDTDELAGFDDVLAQRAIHHHNTVQQRLAR